MIDFGYDNSSRAVGGAGYKCCSKKLQTTVQNGHKLFIYIWWKYTALSNYNSKILMVATDKRLEMGTWPKFL